jgi:hypothetical protein
MGQRHSSTEIGAIIEAQKNVGERAIKVMHENLELEQTIRGYRHGVPTIAAAGTKVVATVPKHARVNYDGNPR